MKGKKIDREFVSEFIEDCIMHNKCEIFDVLSEAKARVSQIDEQILQIQSLKQLRSKLMGVIAMLEKGDTKSIDKQLVSFSQIDNHNICKEICHRIKDLHLDDLKDKYSKADVSLSIKQMVKVHILKMSAGSLSTGELYSAYMSKVHGETA